jgi:DNA-binding LytR/AlgR family response regulator
VVAFEPGAFDPRGCGAGTGRAPRGAEAPSNVGVERLAWIMAAAGGEVNLINVSDVCYFRAEAKYTSVVTAERDFTIRRSIAALVGELDPARFRRIHRSTIVNLAAIAAVGRDMAGETVIRLRRRPERLAVSERYRRDFRPM